MRKKGGKEEKISFGKRSGGQKNNYLNNIHPYFYQILMDGLIDSFITSHMTNKPLALASVDTSK